MKIHITNLYNFNAGDELVKKQHRFADAGRELGFTEMGIFSYPVDTDTPAELNKRLDGIIAALEFDDVVIMQLPTRNGFTYENLLFNKIKAYRSKVIFLLHDLEMINDFDKELQEKYISMFRLADAIIAPSVTAAGMLKGYDLNNLLFCDDIATATFANIDNISSLPCIDFYVKKLLMDAVETIFSVDIMQQRSNLPASEDEIQIAFGLHDKTGNYSVWVGTAMQSIVEHTRSNICFHILHDETVSDGNKMKLTQIATKSGHRIIFYPIDTEHFFKVQNRVGIYSIATMFRLLLPELLPNLSKIIYLDADIYVNRDISELWNIDITNFCLAAVPDMLTIRGEGIPIPVSKKEVPVNSYFNAGILSMNLIRIRQKGNLLEDALHYLERTPETLLLDQDALNVIYYEETLLLDESWNYWARFVRQNNEAQVYKRIYHYVGTFLLLYYGTEMDYQYFETLLRTPWGITEGRKQLLKSLLRMADRINLFEKLLKLLTPNKKKYIFYGNETPAMKNLYELITPREEDYRILDTPIRSENSILSCQNRSLLSKEERGTFIVFVLPEADNGTSISYLEQLGLKNEQDFFVIPRLLPVEKGGYI